MTYTRVVVACEPQLYRQVVAAMLVTLRPCLDVVAAEPEELGRVISARNPHLTICSRLDEPTRSQLLAWVLLYPDGAPYAEISIAGRQSRSLGIDLSQLLTIVDEVEQLAAADPHNCAHSPTPVSLK